MLEESRLPLVHCIPVASITVFVYDTLKLPEKSVKKEYLDKNILKENDMINAFSVLDMK